MVASGARLRPDFRPSYDNSLLPPLCRYRHFRVLQTSYRLFARAPRHAVLQRKPPRPDGRHVDQFHAVLTEFQPHLPREGRKLTEALRRRAGGPLDEPARRHERSPQPAAAHHPSSGHAAIELANERRDRRPAPQSLVPRGPSHDEPAWLPPGGLCLVMPSAPVLRL